jgi:hypothetical protein
MAEVICQTRYRAIGDEAGISVYLAGDSSLSNSIITFSVENTYKVATVNAENTCESVIVSFANLTTDKAYKVECAIINENGDLNTITTVVYAKPKPNELKPKNYRTGGKIKAKTSRMIGVGF